MSKSKNLELRGSTYYARITTPTRLAELRKQAGRKPQREIKKSLGTGEHKIAQARLAAFLADAHEQFAVEEHALEAVVQALPQPVPAVAKTLRSPARDDLEQAVLQFKHDELDSKGVPRQRIQSILVGCSNERVDSTPHSTIKSWSFPKAGGAKVSRLGLFSVSDRQVEEREQFLRALQADLAALDYGRVKIHVDRIIQTKGWNMQPDTDQYRTFARALLVAWAQVLEAAVKRDRGIYQDVAPSHFVDVEPLAVVAQSVIASKVTDQVRPKKGEGIKDYFDQYCREQKDKVTSNAKKDLRATIRSFVELNGDFPIGMYTKDHMRGFKRALKDMPINATKLYPGKTMPQVLAASVGDRNPRLKVPSINNKLSIISKFGNWLEENVEGARADVFKTTLMARTKHEPMLPFSPEQMRQILNANAFVGAKSSQDYSAPGSFKFRDWHFWIPQIAAFTGARLNELAQLRIADIKQVDGIWIFDITDEGDDTSLKTKESKRRIPIHPQLIELGILEYRDSVAAKGWEWLFQSIKPDINGRRSTRAGGWFRKFLTRIGVKGDERGGTHRFRHTLADRLRAAGIDEYDIGMVLGHKVDIARMTTKYGRTVSGTLQQRFDILSKATYPTVDFSILG
jgi:integrase